MQQGTNSQAAAVGITKGPGDTIHDYTFISRDESRLLKNGEYVYYELETSASVAGASDGVAGANGQRHTAPRRVL
ncbi:MAG TPA: hypothetical protein VID72_00930, partial [Ktedonobacterales bacterium]